MPGKSQTHKGHGCRCLQRELTVTKCSSLLSSSTVHPLLAEGSLSQRLRLPAVQLASGIADITSDDSGGVEVERSP